MGHEPLHNGVVAVGVGLQAKIGSRLEGLERARQVADPRECRCDAVQHLDGSWVALRGQALAAAQPTYWTCGR